MHPTKETIDELMKAGEKYFSPVGTKDIYDIGVSRSRNRDTILSRDVNDSGEEPIKVSPHYLRSLQKLLPQLDLSALPQMKLHKHEFFELVYVYQGVFHQVFKNTSFVQQPGQIILLNPHVYHNLYSETLDDIAFNIQIDPEMITKLLDVISDYNYSIFAFFLDAIYGAQKQDYLEVTLTDELEDMIMNLIREYMAKDDFYKEMMTIEAEKLFIYIARNFKSEDRQEHQVEVSLQEQLVSYMRKYYASATLASMSKEFGYTPSYLSGLIRRETGKSFSEHLENYRLEHACALLRSTSLTVTQINQLVGYESENGLFRTMKKAYRISPREYRIKYGRNHDQKQP